MEREIVAPPRREACDASRMGLRREDAKPMIEPRSILT
jgi:hypothetical protein